MICRQSLIVRNPGVQKLSGTIEASERERENMCTCMIEANLKKEKRKQIIKK